jgi:hypothetical protein
VGAFFFNRDAQTLILTPLERMMERVKIIAKNPLAASTGEIDKAGILTMTQKKGKKNKKKKVVEETTILEEAILKIGQLLALGFGEAGSKIIADNMKSQGDLNPLISGVKIMAIFGFCDIWHFSDANEALDIEIMGFVNSIAEVVHT